MHVRFLAASGEATAAATSCLFQDELHENIRWGWLTNSEKPVQIPTADPAERGRVEAPVG
jgi:hypothetical protein